MQDLKNYLKVEILILLYSKAAIMVMMMVNDYLNFLFSFTFFIFLADEEALRKQLEENDKEMQEMQKSYEQKLAEAKALVIFF